MHLWSALRRWASSAPEPTASLPSPDTSPSHSWLTSKARRALIALHHARDRAARLLCAKDITDETHENTRIVLRRLDTAGPPVLGALTFPSLESLVREAGVDVWEDFRHGEEQGLAVRRVLTPSPVYHKIKETAKPFEKTRGMALGVSQAESQSQAPRAAESPQRYTPYPPRAPQPETQGEREQGQTSKYGTQHEKAPELPPRPSCVPDSYGVPLPDIEEDDEVQFGTAVQGTMTRCQRLLDVRRASPVPGESRVRGSASRASFSNSEPPSDAEAASGEVFPGRPSGEYEPERAPPYRCHAHRHPHSDSSSGSSPNADWPRWSHDTTPEQYHLHHIRHALCLPPTTPRRRIEGWLIRNPSVPYHLLTATVPSGPGARRLASGAAAVRENAELEWHLGGVDWEIFRVGRVRGRRRVGRVGRKSLGSRGIVNGGLGVDGGWARAPPGPSKLRVCEVAE